MNKRFFLLFLGITFLLAGCQIKSDRIALADPSIVVDKDAYYMIGGNASGGFSLFRSNELRHWTPLAADTALLTGWPIDGGGANFSAPRITPVDNHYLLTYSANGVLCMAKSNHIEGPYTMCGPVPSPSRGEHAVYSHLFKDSDGKWYIYMTKWEQQDDMEGNIIYGAEFNIKDLSINMHTTTECVRVSEPWELTYDGSQYNQQSVSAPQIVKRDDTYYLFYSANAPKSVDYATGYATANSPLGPWEKHIASPVLHMGATLENGSGGGQFFMGLDKSPYLVYQVHRDDTQATPYGVRIVPIKMAKHRTSGIFHITAKKPDNIIVPRIYYPN